MSTPSPRHDAAWNAALVCVVLLAAALLLVNLTQWPAMWYDEGLHLQVSKNLVLHGQYGLRSDHQFRTFDPLVSVGPTVTLPVAAAFELFGVGLLQARAVMAAYALLALVCLIAVTRQVFDLRTAVVASLWVLVLPRNATDASASFLALGRAVFGEVPALMFLAGGMVAWFKALDRGSTRLLWAAGLLFGLAAVTKPQAMLALVALAVVWIVDRAWHRHLEHRHVALPLVVALACAATWNAFQRFAPGSSFPAQLDGVGHGLVTRAMSALSSPGLMFANLGALSASGALTWGVPGLVYGIHLSRDRSLLGVKRSFLLIVAATWLAWFVAGSIGWLRYAIVGLAMLSPFTARLLVDLAGGFVVRHRHDAATGPTDSVGLYARNLAVAIAVGLMIASPLQRQVREMFEPQKSQVIQFTSELDGLVPPDALIESFEAEVVFLSAREFSQPDLDVLMHTVGHVRLGQDYPPGFHDLDGRVTYLVDGPLAKWTELYVPYLKGHCCRLVHTRGDYDLYAVISPTDRK